MIDITYNEFLNEEMAAISSKKLRDAMHDILVGLGPKETIDVEEMSAQLMSDYKITISPFFLDKFLDDFMRVKRGDRKARTFFTKGDTRWLGVRDNKGTKEMRNNLLHQKPSMGKHKRRLFAEDEKRRLEDAYNAGMKDLNFNEEVVKKSLVLQNQGDSKDIMKHIYSDIVINKYYDNTYDNCWKLMMLIGRNNKLDRVRGYFQYAPDSIKDEFNKTKKWTYVLSKPSEKKKTEPVKKPTTSSTRDFTDLPEITQNNLKKVDVEITQYGRWNAFIKSYSLYDTIRLIDKLTPDSATVVTGMDEFLAKLDQLFIILRRCFMVERAEIINFYKSIGLAGFLREWETMGERPKITNF
jgi:hypothetical protein